MSIRKNKDRKTIVLYLFVGTFYFYGGITQAQTQEKILLERKAFLLDAVRRGDGERHAGEVDFLHKNKEEFRRNSCHFCHRPLRRWNG